MQGWIKKKLDQIDELFPPERLAKSKSRITAVWKGRLPEDRLPFTSNTIYLNVYNDHNGVEENEMRLRVLLDECILHGKMNDDFIPSLFPGCKTSTIPNMFGAEEIRLGNDYSAKKIIHSIEDIYRLGEPKMGPGTTAYHWLNRQRYFLEQTEGRIPIHVTDMQGPMDVCGVMWGYENLLLALYSDPEAVEELLSKLTKTFIKYWRMQEQLLGELFIGTHLFGWSWVPKNNGATISADGMVMVSPDFFDRFYAPVLKNISKELGGVTVHSCGNWSHIVKNIQKIPGLKGLNASQMSLINLKNAGLQNNITMIYLSNYDETFDEIEMIKATSQPTDIAVVGICQDSCSEEFKPPETWTSEDWDMLYRREDKLIEALTL